MAKISLGKWVGLAVWKGRATVYRECNCKIDVSRICSFKLCDFSNCFARDYSNETFLSTGRKGVAIQQVIYSPSWGILHSACPYTVLSGHCNFALPALFHRYAQQSMWMVQFFLHRGRIEGNVKFVFCKDWNIKSNLLFKSDHWTINGPILLPPPHAGRMRAPLIKCYLQQHLPSWPEPSHCWLVNIWRSNLETQHLLCQLRPLQGEEAGLGRG